MISGHKILLSPPHLEGHEAAYIQEAVSSGWIAPAGPFLPRFEQAVCHYTKAPYGVALNSGTAALHLALVLADVQAGNTVFCSTLSFVASANPVVYLGAKPIFIDSQPVIDPTGQRVSSTWNMCPNLLENALKEAAVQNKLPKAVIVAHIFGMPARLAEIQFLCQKYGVILIEDAAESLGSTLSVDGLKVHTGTVGQYGFYSFNGNKIITTSGGGMLVCHQSGEAQQTLKLATQAKEPLPYYEHRQTGYNYRMSNLLAALGTGQIEVLKKRTEQRRAIFKYYKEAFAHLPFVHFQEEPDGFYSNRWLSVILIDRSQKPDFEPEKLRQWLAAYHIEARPVWKPLHSQPVFAQHKSYLNGSADYVFRHGLCLPSGSAMTTQDLERVTGRVCTFFEGKI